MVKVKYLGKQPILVGHKFVYQNEVHSVTAAQLAALQARHDAALFVLLTAPVTKELLSSDYSLPTPVTKELLSSDYNNEAQGVGTEGDPAQNLNNQTEKPAKRRRAKAG